MSDLDESPASTSSDTLVEPTLTRPLARAPVADRPDDRPATPAPAVPPIDGTAPDPIDHRQKRHTWWLASVIILLCAAAGLSIRVLDGDPDVQRVFALGMAACAGSGVWLGRLAWTPARPRDFTIAWFVCSAGICTAILYFGAFSAAPMVAVLAIFFVGVMNAELGAVLATYLTLALFHGGLVVVIGLGAHDPGVVVFPATPDALVILELLIQAILLGTVLIARVVRRSVVKTVHELSQTARAAGQHEVLREDARDALVRSLRSGGGGRFSYQTFGSYRLGGLIGEGAMGEVYDAVDIRTGATAAVKLLRREVLGDSGIVRRFLTEARIVAAIDSAHVVRVLETADVTGSEVPYIAMERLAGRDLRDVLKQAPNGRLPPHQVADLLSQVANGIDAAHGAGIVHRDLKPSNLFQDRAGTWKILDFGVSKIVGELTAENAIVGTPQFMAPELVSGGVIDGRADVFALGVIVYRAVTGALPFVGNQLAEVLYQVVHHTPTPPSRLVAQLPPALDQVVGTALAKHAAARFATARAFAEAFAAAARSAHHG